MILRKFISKYFLNTLLLFILLISYFPGNGQNCNFIPQIVNAQSEYRIDTISREEFNNADNLFSKNNILNIENKTEEFFRKEYPLIFKYDGTGYYFKTTGGDSISVHNVDIGEFSLENSNYEFKGIYCNYALIYYTAYEFWGFISVNLENGLAFYTLGIPKVVDCSIGISFSNYYAEEEINIIDIKSQKLLVIYVDVWTTNSFKYNNSGFFFEMKPLNTNCKNDFKYLKVQIK